MPIRDNHGIGEQKTRSFSLKVTKRIIEQAERQNSRHCMIADALRQRGAWSVNVTAEAARFNHDGTRYTYPLPASVAAKLLAFDDGKPVDPFTFVLNGNSGFSRPVVGVTTKFTKDNPKPKRKIPKKTKGKAKTRAKPAEKRTSRRFHGLRIIETRAAA